VPGRVVQPGASVRFSVAVDSFAPSDSFAVRAIAFKD